VKVSLFLNSLTLLALAACSSASTPGPADATLDAKESCPPKVHYECLDPKTPPSYATDIVPILHDRCAPCHFPGGIVDNKYDFSTYAGIDDLGTAMVNELQMCLMPPFLGNAKYGIEAGTVPALSAGQLDTLVEWFECGAPNN
jgi:hypothetical protein